MNTPYNPPPHVASQIANRAENKAANKAANQPSLDGQTLEMILTRLHALYGWPRLGQLINIKCFTQDPGIKSSLTFLRRTPWARKKVEELFLASPDV